MKNSVGTGFRFDINGLRAFAVLSVLFYHFVPKWLPGGFIGVDVFFVISGYLMTAIIYGGLDCGTFSFIKFYSARVRRIVPPLLFLLFILVLFGLLLLPPNYNKELCKQIASSVSFLSNIFFFKQTGYFSPEAQKQWLLHTWSLAVEFQFYMIYPVCCFVVSKFLGREGLRKGVVIALGVGLLYCIYFSLRSPYGSFFLFPPRAWEMLAGGVVYLYPVTLTNRWKKLLEFAGFVMIACSCFLYSGKMLWPYYYAILPVLGASLILWSSRNHSVITRNRVCQFVGSASYSIYLWHWPIFVFLNFFDVISDLNLFLGVMLSLGMGVLSYYSIEKNVKSFSSKKKFYPILVSCFAILLGGSVLIGRGLIVSPVKYDSRYAFDTLEYHSKFYGGVGFAADTIINLGNGTKKFIMIGDSFGIQYARSLKSRGEDLNFSVTALFDHGCMILPDLTRFLKGTEDVTCSGEYAKLKKMLLQYPELPLVLAFSWDGYDGTLGTKNGDLLNFSSSEEYCDVVVQQLIKLIAEGGDQRKYFIVTSPQYSPKNVVECLSKSNFLFNRTCPSETRQNELPLSLRLKKFVKTNKNVYLIDPNQVLCNDGMCDLLTEDGMPIRSDGWHLSIFGAEPVTDLILSKVFDG